MTLPAQGIFYPPNAYCSNRGLVECDEGYEDSRLQNYNNLCRPVGESFDSVEDEQTCEQNSDCFGDLVCSNNFLCSCYFGYEKWDPYRKRCVKREFGDPCVYDSDCQVRGHNWQGFTYTSGACVDGYCSCSNDGQAVVVSYFEPGLAILKVKTICVLATANVSLTKGDSCTLDPIYNGDSRKARICPTSMMCYQCPEQYENRLEPICRHIVQPTLPTLDNDEQCYPPRIPAPNILTFQSNGPPEVENKNTSCKLSFSID